MTCRKSSTSIYITETVYDDDTGLPIRQLTKRDGKLHSPPDGNAAQILFDDKGRVREMAWWLDGKRHRNLEDGPAVIKINPENDVHYVERYCIDGKTSRTRTEPALILRDEATGQLRETAIFLHGIEFKCITSGLDPEP